MNLDPKKIKELITLYSELDDEYQEELFSKAKVLSIKQTQKNQILKSKEKFKTKKDLDKKIDEKTSRRLEEVKEMMYIYDSKMNDSQRAEIVALLDKLTDGGLTEKTDIEITINHKNVDLIEYLEEQFPDVNVKEANKNANRLLKEFYNN